jgi:fumarylacetoacetate (FAA) hydrolase family protein
MLDLDPTRSLPQDGCAGTLIGRAWLPGEGPAVVLAHADGVFDLSPVAPTVAGLLNHPDPPALIAAAPRDRRLGDIGELLANSAPERRDPTRPWLLAPVDLQAVKAAGVTFVNSLVERVVEEQSRGDPSRAAAVRDSLEREIGHDLAAVKPGSAAAARLKAALQSRGAWSQYLEVGIGPDVEIFTKCQPLAAVGTGADIGLHPGSVWNNPEPEIVLAVNARGEIRGATLGNDVNLRDFEGRSALLLGKAKDNNGSAALGPLLRLFDDTFSLADVRQAEIALEVCGPDGYVLHGSSSMRMISRDPEDIVAQAIGATHQYPDGFVLYLGTMFAPVNDRGAKGEGFTHKEGDVVTISTAKLGALVNRVGRSDRIEPWTFGIEALMRNLAGRGLI